LSLKKSKKKIRKMRVVYILELHTHSVQEEEERLNIFSWL